MLTVTGPDGSRVLGPDGFAVIARDQDGHLIPDGLRAELAEAGFECAGQTGSHERWRAPDDAETISLVVHGQGRECGPKNCHNVRKAIRRSEQRHTEMTAAREAVQEIKARVAVVDDEVPTRVVRLDGCDVEVLVVLKTGRPARLLGTAADARRNVFHYIQDGEWRRGRWPEVLDTTMGTIDRGKVQALVVRQWRDLPEETLDGHVNGYIDVYWMDLGDLFVRDDGAEMGVGLVSVYSGPQVQRPEDVAYTDPNVRLTFDRKLGGTWALGLPYRWIWKVTADRETMWEGLATQAQAVEAAEAVWLALVEEEAVRAVEETAHRSAEDLPPEAGEPVDLDLPEKATMKPRPPSATDHPAMVPVSAELIPRLEALVRALDTPAVRAWTGRGVTVEEVVSRALARGIESLERDLGDVNR